MKRNPLIKIGVLITLILLSILAIRFIFGGPEDDWICTENGWVKHGNPSSEIPASGCEE